MDDAKRVPVLSRRARAVAAAALLGATIAGLLAAVGFLEPEGLWETPKIAWAQPPESEEVSVVLRVARGGEPADALIEVFRGGELVGVEYTDVHTPGEARLSLSPGEYSLYVSQGAGFTMEPLRLDLVVDPGSETPRELSVELEKRFNPRREGYYGVDLHAHSEASAPAMERDFGIRDHGSTPVDQLVAVQRAADLDVMFLSDHNSVEGHRLFAQTAEARKLPYVLSEEVTTLKWGHFNPYSLEPGALVEYTPTKLPPEYFAEARAAGALIIQVNHPLDPGVGYFFAQNDPAYDPSFDVVEALNGPFDDGDFYTVERLFRLWNEGQRYVAVGVSDDHDWKDLAIRYGTPRTYVHVEGELTAERFLESLKAGRAFATYGPLVYVTANGRAIPGDTLTLSDSDSGSEGVRLEIRIESISPLDGLRAEIVRSGRRVAAFELSGHEEQIAWDDPETPQEGDGYVVRLVDAERRYRALTNPIWIGR